MSDLDDDSGLAAVDPATHPARDGVHFRRIRAATKWLREAHRELEDAVAQARQAGDSWAVIATALGTSQEFARARFGSDGRTAGRESS